jgi:hypothetical protein
MALLYIDRVWEGEYSGVVKVESVDGAQALTKVRFEVHGDTRPVWTTQRAFIR